MKLTAKQLRKMIKEEIQNTIGRLPERVIDENDDEKKVPDDGESPVIYYYNNMSAIDSLIDTIPPDGVGEYRKDTLNILIGRLDALADVYRDEEDDDLRDAWDEEDYDQSAARGGD